MGRETVKLIAWSIGIWLPTAVFFSALGGSAQAIAASAALVICLPITAISLWIAGSLPIAQAQLQAAAALAGTPIRMLFVLAAAVAATHVRPELDTIAFWIWLVFAYLLSLSLEVWILVATTRRKPATSGFTNQ